MNRIPIPDDLAVDLRTASNHSFHLWGTLDGDVTDGIATNLQDHSIRVMRVRGFWFEDSIQIKFLGKAFRKLIEQRNDVATVVILSLYDQKVWCQAGLGHQINVLAFDVLRLVP